MADNPFDLFQDEARLLDEHERDMHGCLWCPEEHPKRPDGTEEGVFTGNADDPEMADSMVDTPPIEVDLIPDDPIETGLGGGLD